MAGVSDLDFNAGWRAGVQGKWKLDNMVYCWPWQLRWPGDPPSYQCREMYAITFAWLVSTATSPKLFKRSSESEAFCHYLLKVNTWVCLHTIYAVKELLPRIVRRLLDSSHSIMAWHTWQCELPVTRYVLHNVLSLCARRSHEFYLILGLLYLASLLVAYYTANSSAHLCMYGLQIIQIVPVCTLNHLLLKKLISWMWPWW